MSMILRLMVSGVAGGILALALADGINARAGEFSEHSSSVGQSSRSAERADDSGPSSGLEGLTQEQIESVVGGLTDAENDPDVDRAHVSQWHDVGEDGDGALHDFGPVMDDGGCDSDCQAIEKSYTTDTDEDGVPDAP